MKAKAIIGCLVSVCILSLHIVGAPNVLSTNTWQVTKTRIFEAQANSDEEISENVLNIMEGESNMPEECKKRRFGTYCTQKTDIKVEVNTTWTITEASAIDSAHLSSDEFSEYYPGIQETIKVDNDSPEEDKLVVQRILYERGMLPVAPTGFIGHLTMMGITHLQQLKHIYSEPNGIGPRTIEELNNLKDRMADPEYLEANPLPPPNPYEFAPVLSDVYVDHAGKVDMIIDHPGFYSPAKTVIPIDESPVPFINYVGEIRIVPQTEE
jgi:hypothetical protein